LYGGNLSAAYMMQLFLNHEERENFRFFFPAFARFVTLGSPDMAGFLSGQFKKRH
jgi:hypothetical protein